MIKHKGHEMFRKIFNLFCPRLHKRKYDFVFSIGAACTCTDMLRNCKLQDFSYPFDWVWGGGPRVRFDYLLSEFDGYFDKSDFVLEHMTSNTHHAVWRNIKTGVVYNHDFQENTDNLDDSWDEVHEKYQRRFNRLLSMLHEKSRIAVIYLERPNHADPVATRDELRQIYRKLKNKYPNKTLLDIYYIRQVDTQKSPRIKRLNNHLFDISLDYRWANCQFDWEVDFGKLWQIFKYIEKI